MKVAVPVEADLGMESPVARRFARAPYMAIIDLNSGKVEIIRNEAVTYPRGAGVAVIQFLAAQGVSIVIAPHVGPNAERALRSLGIEIRIVPPGVPLKEALAQAGLKV